MKHLISIHDITYDEIIEIFELSALLKKNLKEGKDHSYLKGKALGMIFTKSSTRAGFF